MGESFIHNKKHIDDFDRVVAPLRKKMDTAIAKENRLHDEYKVSIGEMNRQKRKLSSASKRIEKAEVDYYESQADLTSGLDWMDQTNNELPSTDNNPTVKSWIIRAELLAINLWHENWHFELQHFCQTIVGETDYKLISYQAQLRLLEQMIIVARTKYE
jgi:hypothetical protein